MEFANRGMTQPQTHQTASASAPSHNSGAGRNRSDMPKWMRTVSVVLFLCVAIVLVAVIASLALGKGKGNSEANQVDTSKVQAVFLNGGQVYFGKITALKDGYIKLADIYYLRVNQQVQPGQSNSQPDISLVPLGCELHRPSSEMVINRDQIIFWENLKDDDNLQTVPGAIKDDKKKNPNGHQCTTSQSNNNNSSN